MKYLKKSIPWILLVGLLFYVACDKVQNPQYHVDDTSCNSCGKCIQVCPVDAISGKPKEPYVVNENKCIGCGMCIDKCPADAIERTVS